MKNKKPNIVFLFSDEWRAQAHGYMGDPNAHTPSIDSLAAHSVNFVNAISGCSVCCPYRASLMTGQYPLTHGVYINDVTLDPDCHSIAHAFGEQGYTTGYIGKWHLYGSPKGSCERRRDYVPREYQLGFDYWKGFECNHNYTESYYYFNDEPEKHCWNHEYDAFAQSEDAVNYIAAHAGNDQPFFLMVSYGPPHFPLHTAPEKYCAMYKDREIVLRENVPEDHREKAIEDLRGYYAHIAAIDNCVKMVFESLEDNGIENETIFILTSDHGDMMESQGVHHKWFPFDESIRVPFLLHYPALGKSRNARYSVPIDAPDIYPTLLGLIGAPVPPMVEGIDYSSIVKGERRPTGEECGFLVVPSETTILQHFGFPAYRGVRTERHTYVRTVDRPFMLFDNREDPFQKMNLIDNTAMRPVRDELDSRLREFLVKTGDQFLTSREYLERDGLTHYKETQWECTVRWVSPWG